MVIQEPTGWFRMVKTPHRPLEPGKVRVRIVQTGICDSDVRKWESRPVRVPIQVGHEIAGEVTEVGQGVTGLALGDHVAVWVSTETDATDITHPVRGLADEIVADARHCFTMNPVVRYPFVAEPVGRLLTTIEEAVVRPGLDVVVVGDRFKALVAVMLITRFSEPASVTLISNRNDTVGFVRKLGVAQAIFPDELVPTLGERTSGRGAQIAFELTGTEFGLSLATASLRPEGKLVTGASELDPDRTTPFTFRRFSSSRASPTSEGTVRTKPTGCVRWSEACSFSTTAPSPWTR